MWSFSGDRKVSLPLPEAQALATELSRRTRRELPAAGLNPSQSDKQVATSNAIAVSIEKDSENLQLLRDVAPTAYATRKRSSPSASPAKPTLADFEEMVDATNLSERGSAPSPPPSPPIALQAAAARSPHKAPPWRSAAAREEAALAAAKEKERAREERATMYAVRLCGGCGTQTFTEGWRRGVHGPLRASKLCTGFASLQIASNRTLFDLTCRVLFAVGRPPGGMSTSPIKSEQRKKQQLREPASPRGQRTRRRCLT